MTESVRPMSDERLQELKRVTDRSLSGVYVRECVAEIERLRASLQEKELALAALREQLLEECNVVESLKAEVSRLRQLSTVLQEVATSGYTDIDPRIDYVEVQIDRDIWTKVRQLGTSEVSQ